VSIEKIIKGLKSFENAPHRLEFVTNLNGVNYINDSKATNVDSVYFALDGIDQPIIWIAGGIDKGNDYSQIEQLVKEKVKAIICLGIENESIRNHFSPVIDLIEETRDLNEAINYAEKWSKPGDVVLLSPACASFDLFKNYEDRGNKFKEAVISRQKNKISNL
jgi:UDP-N-acetylmuramoylalanine--D-glutamate ligase